MHPFTYPASAATAAYRHPLLGSQVDTRHEDPERVMAVTVGHLTSYLQIGAADVACTSGCDCEATRIEGCFPLPISVTTLRELAVSQSAHCQVCSHIWSSALFPPSSVHA